jgi:ActR/RegA family two-component response regulator
LSERAPVSRDGSARVGPTSLSPVIRADCQEPVELAQEFKHLSVDEALRTSHLVEAVIAVGLRDPVGNARAAAAARAAKKRSRVLTAVLGWRPDDGGSPSTPVTQCRPGLQEAAAVRRAFAWMNRSSTVEDGRTRRVCRGISVGMLRHIRCCDEAGEVFRPLHQMYSSCKNAREEAVPKTVLLADPSYSICAFLVRQFQELGVEEVWCADTTDNACAIAAISPPDLIVLELQFGRGSTGFGLLRQLRALAPGSPAVVVTGYGSEAAAVRALALGAKACLSKPASAVEILLASGLRSPDAIAANELSLSLEEAKNAYLRAVLEEAGSISEAARRLGLERRAFRRMLARLPA